MTRFITKWWTILPVIALVFSLGVGISVISSSSLDEESTLEGPPEGAFEPFYGVSKELEADLKQIVLSDPTVKELIKDKEHRLIANGQTIIDTDYSLAVGVYLKDDITRPEFLEWILGGRNDSNLIKAYGGVLNVGYNDEYHFVINKEKGEIADFAKYAKSRPAIPEVTALEKQRAIDIALNDTKVLEILAGRSYQIAPNGEIGVWHAGETRLGVAFKIVFDQPFAIDTTLPKYNDAAQSVTGDIGAIIIDVLLDENRVATIIPQSPILH